MFFFCLFWKSSQACRLRDNRTKFRKSYEIGLLPFTRANFLITPITICPLPTNTDKDSASLGLFFQEFVLMNDNRPISLFYYYLSRMRCGQTRWFLEINKNMFRNCICHCACAAEHQTSLGIYGHPYIRSIVTYIPHKWPTPQYSVSIDANHINVLTSFIHSGMPAECLQKLTMNQLPCIA